MSVYLERKEEGEDFYEEYTEKEVADYFEEYIWCDKIGGKVFFYGHCPDWYDDCRISEVHNQRKKKRKTKRERDQKYKQHLKWLAENKGCLVAYKKEWVWDKNLGYVDLPNPYYKRTYRGNHKCHGSKFYKKYSNHVVRRYNGEIHSGGSYKKIFDFWWEVF
jgi:hypothetical protein